MALKMPVSSSAFPVALSILTGLVSLILGLIVLVGWYFNIPALIQINPQWTPIQFNSALCILTCGVCMILITRSRLKLAEGISVIPVLLGILTLFEYITNLNLGIDQLLMKHNITVGTSHPGRMAPNTALCCIFAGTAFLIRCRYSTRKWLPWGLHALGSLVLGLAGIALLGYLTGLENAYGWTSMTRMAILSAAGFLLLGTGILSLPYATQEKKQVPENDPKAYIKQFPILSAPVIGRYAHFALIACFVVLLTIVCVSIWNHASTAKSNVALHQAHRNQLEINEIKSILADVETGERGYALTGDERFLAPYNDALDRLNPHLEKLRQAIGKDPHQEKLLSSLEPLLNKRIEWAKGSVQTRMREGGNPTIARIASGTGKNLTDNIQNIIHSMQQHEHKKAVEYNNQASRSVSLTTATMGAGFTLILAMATMIVLRIRQNIHERQQTEQALREHTALLERFNDLAVGRELRILSLKEEINDLCKRFDIPSRFNEQKDDSHEEDSDEMLLQEYQAAAESSPSVYPTSLNALFCSPVLASVLDSFTHAVGIGAMIIDLNGKILISVRRQRVCSEFHERNEKARSYCIGHNQELAGKVITNKPFTIYNCPNGLTDAIAPIRIMGNHVANIVVGQYFTKVPEMAFFEKMATQYKLDKDRYFSAIDEVPVFSEDTLKPILQFLKGFSELIVEMGLERSKTHNALHHAQKAIQNERKQRAAALSLAEDAQKARQDLQRANEELNRRNSELDEFAFVASHDLQEPLRKLISFGKLLKMDLGGDLPEKAAKDLNFITDAAGRMQALVQDLLTLSRTGRAAMKHEEFSLEDCVDSAIQALSSRIEDTQATIVRDPLPTVMGDPTLVTQLYQNLIGNALKFMPYGKQPEIHITAELNKGKYIFGVRDNGLGIKQEYIEMIFVPFKRLHGRTEFEGSGIGLSICRKVVERHGGGICVESEPGFGSYFKFTLQGPLETDECRKETVKLSSSFS